MRAVYASVEDIEKLTGDIGEDDRARVDFGAYTRERYLDGDEIVSSHCRPEA